VLLWRGAGERRFPKRNLTEIPVEKIVDAKACLQTARQIATQLLPSDPVRFF